MIIEPEVFNHAHVLQKAMLKVVHGIAKILTMPNQFLPIPLLIHHNQFKDNSRQAAKQCGLPSGEPIKLDCNALYFPNSLRLNMPVCYKISIYASRFINEGSVAIKVKI